MTARADPTAASTGEPRPSLLPFNPADLVALRVSPAQFARMCEVSKQSVSQWIKQGKVTLGPDGKLDPAKASREIFERTDPGRLRARVFKSAMEGRDDLRSRVRHLEAELVAQREAAEQQREWITYTTRNACMDAQAQQLAALQDAIAAELDGLIAARQAGTLDQRLDALIARIFYPDALAEAVAADDNMPDHADAAPQETNP